MTESEKKTITPRTFAISSDVFVSLAWFLLRLAVSSAVVTYTIWFCQAPLEHLIARGARNWLALTSSPYYLKTLEHVDGAYAFTSWLGPLRGGFKLPSLLFTFGFPIAYAFALRGISTRRYWLRGAVIMLASYFVCVFAVAIISDARLTAVFLQLEIALQPEWRYEAVRFVQYYLWMFTVRLYPLLSVIFLAVISDQFRSTPRERPIRAVRIFNIATNVLVCALLLVTVGSNATINARIERIEKEPFANRLKPFQAQNPDLGIGLSELGKFLEERKDLKGAHKAYRAAVPRLQGRPRKLARRSRDRIHQLIKDDLLKTADDRRARQTSAK
jgi:hypothetical protein